MDAVHKVGGGHRAIDTHKVGHPQVPVGSVGVLFMGLDLKNSRRSRAGGDASAGGPFPLDRPRLVNPHLLLAEADDDALVLDHRQRQQVIGRRQGQHLAG